jgi:nanoRNase/pAp phosphatase (c-di-AMP/oligoRNAs hydrolase)
VATSDKQRLRRLLGLFSGEDRLLILINADPDSMASAMALKRLLWRQVASISIAHVNEISRPDNWAMIRLIKLNLVPLSSVDLKKFTRFAIVDSQPKHHEAFQGIDFDVVIDHHPDSGIEAPLVDIRPEYGAVSTIMTKYLRAAKIKPSMKLATALFYGIKTDTSNFERQVVMDDVNAFHFLFRYANVQMVRRFEEAELSLESLGYYQKALRDLRVKKHRAQVHLGPVKSPDVCVSIADFFMKVHDVVWSIVSGTCQGRLVIIVRNDGFRKDAGKLLTKAFGDIGLAGGHKTMARAEIQLQNLEGVVKYKDTKALTTWIFRSLEEGT